MAARALTKNAGVANDDEITVVRRTKVPAAALAETARPTTKMDKVDARLIAIARGEVDPEPSVGLFVIDDPFGGLIPVDEDEAIEISDDWLLEDVTTDTHAVLEAAIAFSAVPRIIMNTMDLVALPLDHRTGFLLSHIDGLRTIDEIIDVSNLSISDTAEVLAALVDLKVIAID